MSSTLDQLRSGPPKLSIGVLAGDVMNFAGTIALLEQFAPQGVLLHLDVMDGRVWPKITAGAPILAAEAGRVIHSGRFGAYGKVVILKHAGAYRSVYAHARALFVEKGEFVERGQKIAEVGATGRATGPHLHFEIRRGEVAHDPLVYLP